MLKKRIIPILQYSDYNAIKTKQFSNIRNIGNLLQYVKVFNSRKSDELAIINLSKRFNNISYDFEYLRSVTSECNMPLIIGGSLSSLLEIETLLKLGCDKIILGEVFFNKKSFIKDVIKFFGAQIIIGSVDINFAEGSYFLNHNKNKKYLDHIKMIQDEGIGELLITSVHREGTLKGYDINLIEKIYNTLTATVLINGGASDENNIYDALKIDKVQGACASSIFLFTELTPSVIKKKLLNKVSLRV